MGGRFDRGISPDLAPRGLGVVLRAGGVLLLICYAAGLIGALVLGAWLVGRGLSDRFLWSQYLSWMPTPLAVAAGIVGLTVSFISGLGGARVLRAAPASLSLKLRRRTPGRAIRVAILGLLVVAIPWLLFADLGLHRIATPRRPADAVRVVYLNAGALDSTAATAAIAERAPDVVIVANPRLGASLNLFMNDLRKSVPIREGEAAPTVRLIGQMILATRHPVLDEGRVSLGLNRVDAGSGADPSRDPGRASFVTLDLDPDPESVEPLTVWIADLPRDTGAHRPAVMTAARASIDRWRDPRRQVLGTRTTDEGRTVVVLGDPLAGTSAASEASPAGFPKPDLIVGDFNTPRGADSLKNFTGAGYTSAFDQAGRGWAATFPRERPLAAIDLAFTGAGWRATGFETPDLGAGYHRAVVVDIAPEQAPEQAPEEGPE